MFHDDNEDDSNDDCNEDQSEDEQMTLNNLGALFWIPAHGLNTWHGNQTV